MSVGAPSSTPKVAATRIAIGNTNHIDRCRPVGNNCWIHSNWLARWGEPSSAIMYAPTA
ncbi:hypothetical protein FQZ97_908460 [compost metagenome]